MRRLWNAAEPVSFRVSAQKQPPLVWLLSSTHRAHTEVTLERKGLFIRRLKPSYWSPELMLNSRMAEERAVTCLWNRGLRNAVPQERTIQAGWCGDATCLQNCLAPRSIRSSLCSQHSSSATPRCSRTLFHQAPQAIWPATASISFLLQRNPWRSQVCNVLYLASLRTFWRQPALASS